MRKGLFDHLEIAPASASMLNALNTTGKHIYAGTVPAAVKQRARAKNKVARASRRHQRR